MIPLLLVGLVWWLLIMLLYDIYFTTMMIRYLLDIASRFSCDSLKRKVGQIMAGNARTSYSSNLSTVWNMIHFSSSSSLLLILNRKLFWFDGRRKRTTDVYGPFYLERYRYGKDFPRSSLLIKPFRIIPISFPHLNPNTPYSLEPKSQDRKREIAIGSCTEICRTIQNQGASQTGRSIGDVVASYPLC